MSKSLARVTALLVQAGLPGRPVEMPGETRTAAQAAAAVGCALDQIAKSIIFQRAGSGDIVLFITAGGGQVDMGLAGALAGGALVRADADAVRSATGFAIGGVAPVGLLHPCPVWMDRHLMGFDRIWAAAGTPRHVFPIAPADLRALSGADLADFVLPCRSM